MHRGFLNSKLLLNAQHNSEIVIPNDVKHRFLNILRLKMGEKICLFDGEGHELVGKLEKKEKQVYLVECQFRVATQASSQLTLIQALCPMSKLEDIVRKTTELGIDAILFWQAEYSVAKWDAKVADKIERLNRIAQDAARQSERVYVPMLDYEASLRVAIQREQYAHVFFGKPRTKLNVEVLQKVDAKSSTAIVIGPEGGISPIEIKLLEQNHAQALCFNTHVLRVETAAIAAVALFKALNN